jgi:hypothetical protein
MVPALSRERTKTANLGGRFSFRLGFWGVVPGGKGFDA